MDKKNSKLSHEDDPKLLALWSCRTGGVSGGAAVWLSGVPIKTKLAHSRAYNDASGGAWVARDFALWGAAWEDFRVPRLKLPVVGVDMPDRTKSAIAQAPPCLPREQPFRRCPQHRSPRGMK